VKSPCEEGERKGREREREREREGKSVTKPDDSAKEVKLSQS
jgi:hypothetical protein